jgi:hypothetical protein
MCPSSRLAAGSSRVLGFGPAATALTSDDPATAEWLEEALAPWFAPTRTEPGWHVALSSDAAAYRECRRDLPGAAALRPLLALDTRVLALPAWSSGDTVTFADDEHACVLVVRPTAVRLIGDPTSRRWRMTLLRVLHEIVATRVRRTDVDLHAASVEAADRAILISGPKGAGKTTLSLYLACSGQCRWIANDRAFAGLGSVPALVRGVPTVVALRPATGTDFPALRQPAPALERPHLHTLAELARAGLAPGRPGAVRLALSPVQVVRQLGIRPRAAAPLGAIVFPRIRADVEGCVVERLDPAVVGAELWANRYGCGGRPRAATIFEELSGGFHEPARAAVDALGASVPGYRVVLGRGAYEDPALVPRLLDRLLG